MAKTKQRYKPWEVKDFSAGQVEKLNDNILPDAAAHECRNVFSNRFGGLSVRKGQQRLNVAPLPGVIQGMHPYYLRTTKEHKLIAFSQGLGYLWDDGVFTVFDVEGAESAVDDPAYPLYGAVLINEPLYNHPQGVFPLNPSEPVLFENCVNYVVGMNGVNPPWKWSGGMVSVLENAPAKGYSPVLHKEKLFCVDADNPSTLRWSESFDQEDWPEVNYWDVRKGDGDGITNLVRFVNDLLVFKNRSIHILKGTSLDDFAMHEVHASIGCVGPRASIVHDLKVFFVSEWGIYITNALNVINITDMVIPDLWRRVNKQYLYKASLAVWDEMVRIDLPLDDSRINNFSLFYDAKKQAFWPMDKLSHTCYANFNDGTAVGLRLIAGDALQGYVNIQDEGNSDFGEDIEAYWKGKYFDAGFHEIEKKSKEVLLQDSPKAAGKADLAISIDYNAYEELDVTRTEGYLREFQVPLELNRWRYISPMVKYKGQEACEIRGITIPYKPRGKPGVRTDD